MALGKETDGNQVTTQSSGNHRGSEAPKTDSHTSSISPLSVEQARQELEDAIIDYRVDVTELISERVYPKLDALIATVRAESQQEIDWYRQNYADADQKGYSRGRATADEEHGKTIKALEASLTTAQQERDEYRERLELVVAAREAYDAECIRVFGGCVNHAGRTGPQLMALIRAADIKFTTPTKALLQTRSERSQETNDDGAALLPGDALASPASPEALPTIQEMARKVARDQWAIGWPVDLDALADAVAMSVLVMLRDRSGFAEAVHAINRILDTEFDSDQPCADGYCGTCGAIALFGADYCESHIPPPPPFGSGNQDASAERAQTTSRSAAPESNSHTDISPPQET